MRCPVKINKRHLAELRASSPDGLLPSFAWPGAYPMAYLTADGLEICAGCANKADTSDPVSDGFVSWEGPATVCDDCGRDLETAYGDPDGGL
jgi:hypothetical protein